MIMSRSYHGVSGRSLFSNVLDSLSSVGLHVDRVDSEAMVVYAHSTRSTFSWGEDYIFEVLSGESRGSFQVRVSGTPVRFLNITAGRSMRKKMRAFFSELDSLLFNPQKRRSY